jgi:tetratricopeptide (TPR) repeat protein
VSIEPHESGSYTSRGSGIRREPSFSGSSGPVRTPSVSGFMTAAAAASAALFFVLWWMLQGEENPWIPAGLAASVVMLVAASACLAIVRRSRVRYIRDYDSGEWRGRSRPRSSGNAMPSTSRHSAALRALHKQSLAADAREASPEAHRELYDLCTEYLGGAEQALHAPSLPAETRLALRAGQERVRTLQRHHLLTWARGSARSLTHQAQQRVRLYEKVETANRALECIDAALRIYPDEEELKISAVAVRDFITSSRVAHWVELAERAAFKGYYRRAIDRYRDALFYLTRDSPDQDREAGAERITREIELLRARLATVRAPIDPSGGHSTKAPK